jgi:hypothetical protein
VVATLMPILGIISFFDKNRNSGQYGQEDIP